MWESRRFRAKKDDYKERLDENGKNRKDGMRQRRIN
jgi:hypothetical protein